MSVARKYVVQCDEQTAVICSAAFATEKAENPVQARHEANRAGWVTIGQRGAGLAGVRDICPACLLKIRTQTPTRRTML